MDRLFLDANVLFSAAYRESAGLLRFWNLSEVVLLGSEYAITEARFNLSEDLQQRRLDKLLSQVEVHYGASLGSLPRGIDLPEKDRPILLDAIAASASHLITGDKSHFGQFFDKKISGILVLTPSEYLVLRR